MFVLTKVSQSSLTLSSMSLAVCISEKAGFSQERISALPRLYQDLLKDHLYHSCTCQEYLQEKLLEMRKKFSFLREMASVRHRISWLLRSYHLHCVFRAPTEVMDYSLKYKALFQPILFPVMTLTSFSSSSSFSLVRKQPLLPLLTKSQNSAEGRVTGFEVEITVFLWSLILQGK